MTPARIWDHPLARRAVALLARDRSGARDLVVVLLTLVVLTAPAWIVASSVEGVVRALMATGDCRVQQPGSVLLHTCAVGFGVATLVIPASWLVVLSYARSWIAARIGAAALRLPPDLRYLAAPVFGALAFLVPWAFIHADTGARLGIVPQWAFPALIATLGHATERYGLELRGLLAEFFARRDALPLSARSALGLGVPFVVALLIAPGTPARGPDLAEQVVALVGFACGYLSLAPARGRLGSSLGAALAELRPVGRAITRAMAIASRLRRAGTRGAGVALVLALTEPVRAHACASHSSCAYEPGYTTVMGVAGGVLALATTALMAEVASPMVLAADARKAKTSTEQPLLPGLPAVPWLPLAAIAVGTAVVLALGRIGGTGTTLPSGTATSVPRATPGATPTNVLFRSRVDQVAFVHDGVCDPYVVTIFPDPELAGRTVVLELTSTQMPDAPTAKQLAPPQRAEGVVGPSSPSITTPVYAFTSATVKAVSVDGAGATGSFTFGNTGNAQCR